MAKQESTAINDLIHLANGRIIDDGQDAQDHLFVTAQSRAMPAPLPRRRAPNATPPLVPVHDYDDDEVATSVDPHAVGPDPRWALGSAPNPRPSAPLVAPWPQPILPQYALPTPAPLPPAPYHADSDATERVERYDALPPQTWSARPALPPRPTGPFEEHLDTVRVPALPPPPDAYVEDAPPSELVVMMKKCALPFAGLAIALMFVGGYVVHRGQGGHKRAVPVATAVAAAPVAAPIVTPIEPAADTAPATWKPTAVQPTIATASEPASEPASAPESESASASASDPEIEMEPATVTRPRKHRAKKTSDAPSRIVARVARPEARVARPEYKPARARSADPVAVALAEPTKSTKPTAKGTGPGTVTITSTPSALIYIDGRSTNQMTPKTLTLAPGVHKITLLEVSSRKAKTAEVDVAAGGSAQIAKKF